ncbi:MAG TPA: DUF2286 domain-containing protein, partial [Candidatus Methanomethylicus sp.]|nr:DUF2286 domain-containing protein [Candidatus Methanomethylicus sp.]
YIISFDNEWQEEAYVDKEVLVVAPMLDAAVDEKVVELAIESTKPNVPGEHEEGCGCGCEDEDCECDSDSEECEEEGAPEEQPAKGRK